MENNIDKIIYPVFDGTTFKGCCVDVNQEKFIIAPHNTNNLFNNKWSDVKSYLKKNNKHTWNYPQICLTMAFRHEIDYVLNKYGGDVLNDNYWTLAEYSSFATYVYFGKECSLPVECKFATDKAVREIIYE